MHHLHRLIRICPLSTHRKTIDIHVYIFQHIFLDVKATVGERVSLSFARLFRFANSNNAVFADRDRDSSMETCSERVLCTFFFPFMRVLFRFFARQCLLDALVTEFLRRLVSRWVCRMCIEVNWLGEKRVFVQEIVFFSNVGQIRSDGNGVSRFGRLRWFRFCRFALRCMCKYFSLQKSAVVLNNFVNGRFRVHRWRDALVASHRHRIYNCNLSSRTNFFYNTSQLDSYVNSYVRRIYFALWTVKSPNFGVRECDVFRIRPMFSRSES